VQFSDLRLLLFPVRSIAGTFAWVTSPYLLNRLARDLQSIGENTEMPSELPRLSQMDCLVSEKNCQVTFSSNVILEDLDLKAMPHQAASQWAEWIGNRVFPEDKTWQEMLVERFAVVKDSVMNFLLETATEISARIRLKEDTKTVAKGGLWYEEALPTETILVGLVLATQVKATTDEVFETISQLTKKPLQFGGKATVGRGLCRLQMLEV
ncbi:MAG TPA: type III-B CRISPR module RAMP protein Cmr4, partial [Candidatus Acidoferrales bacterium]|nr:type III-B CRISPR module RAMP protein Cmr4 [Candidatus Acidoferrales bacterium]